MSVNTSSNITNAKILVTETIADVIGKWQAENKSIVFTNGCFDILHLGHVDYLSKAADLGDKLVVGLNSDASVKKLNKGDTRPIQDECSRATILAALHFVDAVIVFEEDTPLVLIDQIKPAILVKGADYDENETDPNSKTYVVGSKEVKSYDGIVKTIEFLDGYSTSKIEQKIKDSTNK